MPTSRSTHDHLAKRCAATKGSHRRVSHGLWSLETLRLHDRGDGNSGFNSIHLYRYTPILKALPAEIKGQLTRCYFTRRQSENVLLISKCSVMTCVSRRPTWTSHRSRFGRVSVSALKSNFEFRQELERKARILWLSR